MRKIKGLPVKREVVEKMAAIFGPMSAAAMALADAESHNGPVEFINTGSSIGVVKHPPPESAP